MKKKIFYALGLMSGTSMDGVDLSLIETDGYHYFTQISDKYYDFSDQLYRDLIFLRENIRSSEELHEHYSVVKEIEKKIYSF